jgi:peptide subunit release factor 1 (eRF1)
MLTEAEFKDLLTRRPTTHPVTSLYLRVEGSNAAKNDYRILVKDLIKEKKAALAKNGFASSKAASDSVQEDFERIQRYLEQQFQRKGARGIAVFSSTGEGFWKVLTLRQPVPDRLDVRPRPVVRPLSLLLDDYRRFATVLVGRDHAKIYEVHLGEIVEHKEVFTDVSGRVRVGGFQGYDEKRIVRHHEEEVKRHLKAVADKTLEFFRKEAFDRLIVGCQSGLLNEFLPVLHSYLRERLVATLAVGPEIPEKEALARTTAAVAEAEKREEAEITDRVLGNHGRAAIGLPASLHAVSGREAEVLVVGKTLEAPGAACDACHYLGVEAGACPRCGGSTRKVSEVVEEAIQVAYLDGSRIEHVDESEAFRSAGGIGALLRFRR